jgi:RHS repeat-associated protein
MTWDGAKAWTYNNLLQATQAGHMTYNYSATKNNGQITSSVDAVTGETITYQYDLLKRLESASGKNWGETYTYDGFGNMTQMAPTGTAGAPSLSVTVNANTNRLTPSGTLYDNNGNLLLGFPGIELQYDAANRISEVMEGAGNSFYGYDSDNRRIYYRNTSNSETIYFYGADGKKLATYTYTIIQYQTQDDPEIQLMEQSKNVYFAGLMLTEEGNSVSTDRLGSVRSGGPGGLGYQAEYPYGVEYTVTANDREKYATYTRDSLTGFDYAVNRYYSSQWGRFLSPDPYGHANLTDPPTWNQYNYAGNDPVNGTDPLGLCTVIIAGITQSPGANAVTQAAANLGADSAYPFQGQSTVSSVASVFAPGNSTTLPAFNAILYALASTNGSVDIIAYSGGAAAFTAAYGELSSAQQARIGLVLYLSPGVAGSIADVSGTTRVVTGATQGADPLAMVGTEIPSDVPTSNTGCDHTDFACLMNSFWGKKLVTGMQEKGSCSNPEVFTRSSPAGTPGFGYGTGGGTSGSTGSGGAGQFGGGGSGIWQSYWQWSLLQPTEVVSSTFKAN